MLMHVHHDHFVPLNPGIRFLFFIRFIITIGICEFPDRGTLRNDYFITQDANTQWGIDLGSLIKYF